MTDLGELDRPGTPNSPGPWDERSEEWLEGEGAESEAYGGGDAESEPSGVEGAESEPSGGEGAEIEPYGRDDAATEPSGGKGVEATGGLEEPPAARPRPTASKASSSRRQQHQTTTATTARRTAADPVKALMHRHRDLCERAVDPLEIAAGLEAHGVTDRTATRFRHRDVFSLAEEMYARVPRDAETPSLAPPPAAPRVSADWLLLTLLPGALCAATVAGLRLTTGQPRLIAAVVGTLAVALSLRAALARGPLRTTHHTPPRTVTLTCWLAAYALLGDGLLQAAVSGGPDALPTGAQDGPWPLTTATVLALTLSCAPAAWTARLLTAGARRKLSLSRGLEDFTSSVLPLLLGAVALYLCALASLLTLTGAVLSTPAPYAQTVTLGALLFLGRLLTTHGFTHAPALVLTATAATELTALAAVFTSRLPGCDFLAAPVETVVAAWGAGSIPTLACGAGAAVLLLHATRRLTRASAHAPVTDQPW
ncbi:hypothetical protein [Streptomyces sp. S.PB5]|uniref:hypothetical protein n=1 Tax=Streptomyces sp. S.PB5 TaxID=3020844 RepID=UPI0025AF89F5|nr:hypothetical protein [Streptomyces sp. S.PB5]MDN3026598.1 hypothetical protein [Streptomyces sp. S.PB5]